MFERIKRTLPNLSITLGLGAKQTHPFTIDRHISSRIKTKTLNFGDVFHVLHVSRIATGSEDNRDLRLWVYIVRCD